MHQDIDDLPNFLLVKDKIEEPEEIIEDYVAMILELSDNPEAIQEIMDQFFGEVYAWTAKSILISQAKAAIYNLQVIEEGIEMDNDFEDD